MVRWFSKRLESILDNITFAAVVAVSVAIWNAIQSLPLLWIVIISGGTFLFILVVIRLVVFFRHKHKTKSIAKEESEHLIDKKDDLNSNLSITYSPMDKYVRTHKCSQCDFGFKVNVFNQYATCPKCGNID